MTADALTIIRARGKRLAKLIGTDGSIQDYEGAYRYDAAEVEVNSLQQLGGFLSRLLPRPDCAVVRGAPIGGQRVEGIRRLLHEQKDGTAPTLRHVTHHWLAIDCDDVPCPETFDRTDIQVSAEMAIERLPPTFQNANVIAVASGSHGIKPGIRTRLWFWLARPMGTIELKIWLSRYPVDTSVFGPAQLIYTAAPVFDYPRIDHLPLRMVELPGEEFVHPPAPEELKLPEREPITVEVVNSDTTGQENADDSYITGVLQMAALNIMTASVGQRHDTLVREACGLARYINAGHLTAGEVTRLLSNAAAHAGKDDENEVALAIEWGLSNQNVKPIPNERLRRAR